MSSFRECDSCTCHGKVLGENNLPSQLPYCRRYRRNEIQLAERSHFIRALRTILIFSSFKGLEPLIVFRHESGISSRAQASRKSSGLVSLCALLLFVLIASLSHAQISPGPLSRAHSSLNGATNCISCHKLGSLKTYKCLECHTEIASRISSGRGFHARVVQKDSGSQGCSNCHSEHNGENFALIRWDPSVERFDHAKTGWPLQGKHASTTCQKCHTAAHIQQSEGAGIRMKDLNRSFLGLSTTCVACHQDPHQGHFGKKCEQCHTTNDWKVVGKFDHSKTRFPLTGAHLQVTCAKCHTPGPDGTPRWTGLKFSRCADCHADPHQGKFAAKSCESCHTTTGWKTVSTTQVQSNFDHNKTKYPLLGKHATVRCDACHKGGNFNKPLAFEKCTDCHTPDPHGGQFIKRHDRGECSACHTVNGFKPANFGLKEHAATAYPLEGKHADVTCAKCHTPAGTATVYKLKFAACTNCHKDEHLGQFAAAPHVNRCQDCHTVQGFQPSTFTLAMHKNTKFNLAGAHLAVPCSDCHKPGMSARFKDVAQYRFDDRSCTACHRDPHNGQFRDRMTRVNNGRQAGCEACHSVTTWQDLSKFDHSSTKFPLLGSHRAVSCDACHKPPNLEVKLMNVDFHAAPSACESCHADIHGGQFAESGKITKCASCHNSAKWKPSIFNHDTRTSFPLQGEHRNVRCDGCHKSMKLIDGKQVLFYKPTPKECSACHGAEIKKSGAKSFI